MIMKRAVATVLCWAALAIAATAQTMLSKEERDFLTNYMRESQQKLFKEIGALSDAQMKFKPSANAWSVFEIGEHLAKGEDVIFNLVTNTMLKAPAQPELKGEKGPRIKDLAVVMYMTKTFLSMATASSFRLCRRAPVMVISCMQSSRHRRPASVLLCCER